MYADKISMAHGLEVRVPFLDKDVVEFAQRLPAAFKVRWGQRKWLHRRVCEQFLPKEILARKKRGFAVNVVDQWFEGSMNSKLSSYLLDGTSRMFEFLEPRAVSRLLDEHRSGRRDNHKMLFSLVVLEEWLRANAGALERHEGAELGQAAAAALG
jgi:asparagine synthase (glutamine-hydrolysing)